VLFQGGTIRIFLRGKSSQPILGKDIIFLENFSSFGGLGVSLSVSRGGGKKAFPYTEQYSSNGRIAELFFRGRGIRSHNKYSSPRSVPHPLRGKKRALLRGKNILEHRHNPKTFTRNKLL